MKTLSTFELSRMNIFLGRKIYSPFDQMRRRRNLSLNVARSVTRGAKNHERRLITGGKGKRGSRTCRRLLETNDSVGRIWRSYRLR